MHISRAGFLKTCAFALAGGRASASVFLTGSPALPGAAADAWSDRGPISLEDATADLFKPHVNSAFTVRAAGTSRQLLLVKVAERPLADNVEQFSLVLHGSAAEPLADGSYCFSHPVLGRADLCINTVGTSDPRRTVYQACFSRFISNHSRAGATPRPEAVRRTSSHG
jgi:hypothetical protein